MTPYVFVREGSGVVRRHRRPGDIEVTIDPNVYVNGREIMRELLRRIRDNL